MDAKLRGFLGCCLPLKSTFYLRHHLHDSHIIAGRAINSHFMTGKRKHSASTCSSPSLEQGRGVKATKVEDCDAVSSLLLHGCIIFTRTDSCLCRLLSLLPMHLIPFSLRYPLTHPSMSQLSASTAVCTSDLRYLHTHNSPPLSLPLPSPHLIYLSHLPASTSTIAIHTRLRRSVQPADRSSRTKQKPPFKPTFRPLYTHSAPRETHCHLPPPTPRPHFLLKDCLSRKRIYMRIRGAICGPRKIRARVR